MTNSLGFVISILPTHSKNIQEREGFFVVLHKYKENLLLQMSPSPLYVGAYAFCYVFYWKLLPRLELGIEILSQFSERYLQRNICTNSYSGKYEFI